MNQVQCRAQTRRLNKMCRHSSPHEPINTGTKYLFHNCRNERMMCCFIHYLVTFDPATVQQTHHPGIDIDNNSDMED